MEKTQKTRSFISIFTKALIVFIALILVVYFVSVLMGTGMFFGESSEKSAKIHLDSVVDKTEALVSTHYANLYEVAERLQYSKSRDEVEEVITSYIGTSHFGDLRYFSQGVSYSSTGVVVEEEHSGKEYIDALAKSMVHGASPIYFDVTVKTDCIAFFVPVRGSEFVDGVLSVVPARNIINISSIESEKAAVIALIDKEGKVYGDKTSDSFTTSVGNSFHGFLEGLTFNKEDTNALNDAIISGKKSAFSIKTGDTRYTVALAPLSGFSGNLFLATMSESEMLISSEQNYIRNIINLLTIAVVSLMVSFVYAILYHRKSKQAISNAALTDSKLYCPNDVQFKISTKDLIAFRNNKYSIASVSVKNFFYIRDQLGEKSSTELLRSMIKIIESLTSNEECYGYAGDGKFLMLIINANQHTVKDKIKLIETITNREEILKEKNIKLRFSTGVYNIAQIRRRTVDEMIDCANTARGFLDKSADSSYTVFTEEVRAEIERNEKIESVMESALKDKEFRLFLQPKYNVKNDAIDSAEALVRWFDPRKGDYRFPGEFIPLFETNGFIVKLDHYIYIEVLEYLSRAVERGEKVVPIAVNVSRVTAISPDFINFYVGNKNKYRIPDGFITLELTESFAMEDYEKIFYIVTSLHNAGLRCAIDDFGSSYSSFSILKQITVDELKLDNVFVKRGIDIKRDDTLLATIIGLGKSMGMRIVQEGVETKEIFDKVIEMGCDVIQGYYYAKAISLEEFRVFISTNTSIKYKSLVK